MKSSLARALVVMLAVCTSAVGSLAHAGDNDRSSRAGQARAAQMQAARIQAAQMQAARAQAARQQAAQARMMQARAAQLRQAQAAKAGMATAMVTAATLAATDAGECSPYLAKWMTTRNPAWQARYEACMDDD